MLTLADFQRDMQLQLIIKIGYVYFGLPDSCDCDDCCRLNLNCLK